MPEIPQKTQQTTRSASLFYIVAGICATRYAAGFFPTGRIWGLNYLHFIPFPLDLILGFLPLLLFIPSVLNRLYRVFETVSENKVRLGTATLYGLFAIAVLLFPLQTFFYGDGGNLIPQIFRVTSGNLYDADLLLNAKSSPLAGAMLILFAKWVPSVLSFCALPLPTTALYPFLWMGVFFLLVLGIFRIFIKTTDRSSLVLYLSPLATAGVLLFFGYAEYYLLAYIAFFCYMLYAQRIQGGGGRMSVLFLFLLLAIASHYYALILIPSFLYLIAVRSSRFRNIFSSNSRFYLIPVAAFILVCLTYFLAGWYGRDSRIFMPLLEQHAPAGTLRYTLLSMYHITDIANILVLLAPLPLVILIGRVFPGSGKKLPDSVDFRFQFLNLFFFLAFIFFGNTSLGLARDWDLTIPLGIILLFLLSAAYKNTGMAVSKLALVFTACALYVIPWLAVNLQPAWSVKRFEVVLKLDEDHMYKDYALSGYEALRKYYVNQKDTVKDIELSQQKIRILQYPAHYALFLEKLQYFQTRDRDYYRQLFAWTLDQLGKKADQLQSLPGGRDYEISLKSIDSLTTSIAVRLFLEGEFSLFAKRITNIGEITQIHSSATAIQAYDLYQKKQFSESIEFFQQTLDKDVHLPSLYAFMSSALGISKRYAETIHILEQGIDKYPNDLSLLLMISNYYIQSGKYHDRAAAYLQHCLELHPNSKQMQTIEQLSSRLR
jgi:tetratricopeptide (TPR) repeat protein